MAAGKANILLEQGANLNLQVNLTDTTGAAVNLTGYHAKFQVRPAAGSSVLLLALDDAGLGGLTLGGTNGTVSIAASATQTKGINLSSLPTTQVTALVGLDALGNPINATGFQAVYSLEITDPGSNVTRVLEGMAIIDPEVIA
jgi:hypothetical protein